MPPWPRPEAETACQPSLHTRPLRDSQHSAWLNTQVLLAFALMSQLINGTLQHICDSRLLRSRKDNITARNMIKFEKVRVFKYLLNRTDKTDLARRVIFACAYLDLDVVPVRWFAGHGESWSMAIVPQYHSCRIYDQVLGLRWRNHVNTLLILQECLKIDLVSDR